MGHVVKKLDWCEIDIDTTKGRIFLQQRWKYDWKVRLGQNAWTPSQRRKFHNSVDKQIWKAWSNRVRLNVTGDGGFAKRFRSRGIPIDLDVKWVLKDQQWDVTVWKLPKGVFEHSTVNFGTRKIKLNTNTATKERRACNRATPKVCREGFRSATHEFGHTLDNDDEYGSDSAHFADSRSILNIGQQLRVRHFNTIINALNTMMKDVTFSIGSIRNPN